MLNNFALCHKHSDLHILSFWCQLALWECLSLASVTVCQYKCVSWQRPSGTVDTPAALWQSWHPSSQLPRAQLCASRPVFCCVTQNSMPIFLRLCVPEIISMFPLNISLMALVELFFCLLNTFDCVIWYKNIIILSHKQTNNVLMDNSNFVRIKSFYISSHKLHSCFRFKWLNE